MSGTAAAALQLLAAAALALFLWSLFRLALGLRAAKVAREGARRAEEERGRRVVAEIPLSEGEVIFFLDDGDAFRWGDSSARKSEIVGARMLLNGAVVGSFSRDGAPLPDPPVPAEYEGRERWDVRLYLRDGRALEVPCGTMREGVSCEIAAKVFDAVRVAATRR